MVHAPTTTTRPSQGQDLAAVGADLASIAAIVDLADGAQHRAARVPISAENAGDILDNQQAVAAELA